MRILILVVSFMFLGYTVQPVYANNPEVKISTLKVDNYIMTTGVANYVPVMIMTAAEMRKEEGKQVGEFQIVLYGAAVKQFADKEAGQKLVDMAKEAGAKIVLCDFALKHFGIDSASLPKGLEYVHNAFKYGLNMKVKGYITLSV